MDFLLFAQDGQIFSDKAITSGGVCAVLLVIVWQLPTLIKLLLENRKEVAEHMAVQSQAFSTTADKILLKYDTLDSRVDLMVNAFKDLLNNLNNNQDAIKILLTDIKERNEKLTGS